MITTATSFAMHLFLSSFQGVRAARQIFNYMRTMSSAKPKINFNSKHLTKGDPLPPYNGKPRLYNMRFCPYAHRAVLALNAKNIDYEIINVDLKDKPEWLVTKSAFSKVPALEVADGVSIYESLVIAEYLDDAYPEKPLVSKDPVRKAFDKILIEATAPVQGLLIKLVKAPETVNEDVLAAYYKALSFLQSELQKRGTKFLGGDEPGFVDYMIWPWFERLTGIDDKRIEPDAKEFKLFRQYINDVRHSPVVLEYAIPSEVFAEFHAAFSAGTKPNYDLLLDK